MLASCRVIRVPVLYFSPLNWLFLKVSSLPSENRWSFHDCTAVQITVQQYAALQLLFVISIALLFVWALHCFFFTVQLLPPPAAGFAGQSLWSSSSAAHSSLSTKHSKDAERLLLLGRRCSPSLWYSAAVRERMLPHSVGLSNQEEQPPRPSSYCAELHHGGVTLQSWR